ncbi:hypothetical protein ABN763_03075 [Spongiivirga sp. MCCC 1A20706]|uniref:hypothetical protein n=1 Tax=Spongiivirga sp. MCCC 1A20706 TaxID=3160963 RepID=UPI003977748F
MKVHLLDLFKMQFTDMIGHKIAKFLNLPTSFEEVNEYAENCAFHLIKELSVFNHDKDIFKLLQELLNDTPYIDTPSILDDTDLAIDKLVRNGKYFVHAIYGVEHLSFLKLIESSNALSKNQRLNVWYLSGSIILMLIRSLTANENSLIDLLKALKKEVEISSNKRPSFFMNLLSF